MQSLMMSRFPDSLKYVSFDFVVKTEARNLRAWSLYLNGFFVLLCFKSSMSADLSSILKSEEDYVIVLLINAQDNFPSYVTYLRLCLHGKEHKTQLEVR